MFDTKDQIVTVIQYLYLNVGDAEGFLPYTMFLHNENINSVSTLNNSNENFSINIF